MLKIKLKYFILMTAYYFSPSDCMAQSSEGGFKIDSFPSQNFKQNFNANALKVFGFCPVQTITDSGVVLNMFQRGSCKGYSWVKEFTPNRPEVIINPIKIVLPAIKRIEFLTVHGNISYDYFYRSKIDTPFNQENFQQHTEKIYLDLLVKEKYPFKVALVARQSNSAFFRDFNDVNFQFDRYSYYRSTRQDLINRISEQLLQQPDLKTKERLLTTQIDEYAVLKKWLESTSTLQKLIEERERQYNKQQTEKVDFKKKSTPSISSIPAASLAELQSGKSWDLLFSKARKMQHKLAAKILEPAQSKNNVPDSLMAKIKEKKYGTDSITATSKDKSISFSELVAQKKAELDSLERKINSSKEQIAHLKDSLQNDLAATRQKIYSAANETELRRIAKAKQVELPEQNKFEKHLASIKSFSVGRSMLNYTELTAQNIMVSGVNIEYNPSYYAAFAAGKIDYRFKDFYNNKSKNNGQYLVLGRLGIGDRDKKALIFTMFQGRKNHSEFVLSDSIRSSVDIIGYSMEAIYKKDENTGISAEFAKSTKPVSGSLQTKEVNTLTKFSDQTNMGVNIKAQTSIVYTDTKLSGFFRKTGENFQSFSLFSYNTDQTAWLIRADQYLLKNKVSVTGMLRQNDFTNPFTDKTFKTSTTFKTVLLNIRVPKYPSVSLGYYPGTQLYIVNKDRLRENAYYILNGSMTYTYLYNEIGMNSSVVFNRYFNKATDSGFVLYKGINYYASQVFFFKKLQLQGSYSYTKQSELNYYTLETTADYSLKNYLKIAGGLKFNKISGGSNYWGERILLTADFKRLGGLQIQYEKSYLPTINQTLYPVEIGRVSWYKYF